MQSAANEMLDPKEPFEKEIKFLVGLTYGLFLVYIIVYFAKLMIDHPF